VEMILCPCMWYGNAREDDMDWGQFCIMFRSIFMEGFARPLAGVRLILKNMVRRFRELGGELKLRSGVSKIHVEGDRAAGVVLESGEELEAGNILSSAGAPETLRMCDDMTAVEPVRSGNLSFTEAISVLDRPPKEIGYGETIVFFNDSERFHWRKPADELCDVRTGVICSPNNFAYQGDEGLDAGYVRTTGLANHERWRDLPEEEYRLAKLQWYDRMIESAVRFIPDFRHRVIDTDMFTPSTIRRFTFHDNGAIYGAPTKNLDGTTHLKNLFICGTDQGFLGIIGAITSGIAMANRHCLRA
jgi:phytoene dehydrogenase-like protein